MNFKDSLITEREPSLGADPGESVARDEGKTDKKHQDPNVPARDTRIEQAETRIDHAEMRIDHAEIRIEDAETLIEQVAVQTEQVATQTEQAAMQTEQAATKTQEAETQTQEAKTRTDQANARTKQAEMRTHQANTRTDEANTRTDQANTRTDQANTRTEQAEARNVQAILASEIRYRRLFETAQDGILILDAETGQVVDANPFMKDLLGYSQEEFLGRKLWEIGPFKGSAASKTAFAELQLKDRIRYEALPLETKDGRRVEVEFISNAYLVENKRLIQCNIRDVTERKRAEEELKASLKEVNDLKTALDEHAIVAMTNPKGKITYVNDKFCIISKYSREELLGQDHRIINSGYHSKEFIRELWATITHGNVWHGEIKNRAKDGSHYWVDTTIVPFLSDDGKPRQYVVIRADTTERKRAEEEIRSLNAGLEQRVAERTIELQSAKEQAESADRMKSAFLANMSHELRTPLNGIIGFSEFLIDGKTGALTDKQREYVTDIFNSGRHLLQLINDVLDLAKVEAGKMDLHPESFSVAKAVEEVNSIIGPMAQRKSIEVSSTVEPAADEVTLDKQKLKQVLFNLLSNAVKFTEDAGSVKLIVDLYDETRLRLQVHDSGIGIKPEDLDKLFIEFRQLDSGPARRHQGTGLGLALTKRIVEFQSGTIEVESTPGKGSTFTVILPRVSGEKIA